MLVITVISSSELQLNLTNQESKGLQYIFCLQFCNLSFMLMEVVCRDWTMIAYKSFSLITFSLTKVQLYYNLELLLYLLAPKMKAGRTAIATNQITSFTACVAGVMIVTLTRSFIIWMLRLFRFWRDQIFIRWLYYRPYKLKLQPYHLYYSLVDQSSYQIRIIICPVRNITV